MNSTDKIIQPEKTSGFDPVLKIKFEVISYIYINGFKHINLNKHELDYNFLINVIDHDNLKSIANIYLTILEKTNDPEYTKLKKPNGFDFDEIIKSLSASLQSDFSKHGVVFHILKDKIHNDYKDNNPIKELLNSPYLRNFCNGLELNYSTRICLILSLINSLTSWIFPEDKDNDYKTKLFMDFIDKDVKDPLAYARKINNHLIQLGLFKAPWTPSNYTGSFFHGGINSYSFSRVIPVLDEDYYDPIYIKVLNNDEITLSSKLIKNCCRKQNKNWQLYSGTEYHRIKNVLANVGKIDGFNVYEFKTELLGCNKYEQEFYIYALSTQLQNTKSVILLPENISRNFILQETEEATIFENADSILKHVRVPVILTANEKPENNDNLSKNGIDLDFSVNIKLPDSNTYNESFCNFLCKEKVPANVVASATNICTKMMVSSSKWHEIADLLKNTTYFSKTEITMLLERKYGNSNVNNDCTQNKDTHYCLEALNTSVPINQLIEELKNAAEFQKHEYNDKSGARGLLTGISGGGKTRLVEETANILHKKLQVIRASEILSSFVGETEKNIKTAFEKAAKDKAILLIDEADSFLQPRGDNINHHNDMMVNEFLVQMERFPGILFCNTNLPENLDKALDRRFHFKINFKPLTKDGISLLCKSYFEQYNLSEAQINKIYDSGDVCPGDFGALNGKIRFVAKNKINADYITTELCKIVKDKQRSWETKKIGFGN